MQVVQSANIKTNINETKSEDRLTIRPHIYDLLWLNNVGLVQFVNTEVHFSLKGNDNDLLNSAKFL